MKKKDETTQTNYITENEKIIEKNDAQTQTNSITEKKTEDNDDSIDLDNEIINNYLHMYPLFTWDTYIHEKFIWFNLGKENKEGKNYLLKHLSNYFQCDLSNFKRSYLGNNIEEEFLYEKIDNTDNMFFVGAMGAFGISISASIAKMIVEEYINQLKL